MIDLYLSMLPYYDHQEQRGGYKIGMMLHDDGTMDFIGPTNRNSWHRSSKFHNLMFCRDLLDYLENLAGPGRSPESRRIICYDETPAASLIIPAMLYRGYKQTMSWTPKKGEFFLLEDSSAIHCLVFRSKKTGAETRFVSIKQFVRGHGLPAIWDQVRDHDSIPIGDLPVEEWDEPSMGGMSAINQHCQTLREIWHRAYRSGYIYETSGRNISAGGIAWSGLKREIYAATQQKLYQFLYPNLSPERIKIARDVMEDELRPGSRGGLGYAVPGLYADVHGYDLNSAYGAALCDYIPFGPLLNTVPKEGLFTGIVWPQGYFGLKSGMIPILSWSNENQCARYRWEHLYKPHEKITEFFLDGSLPFYQEEWALLMEFYVPVGAYEIPKFAYIEIMRWGLLENRIKRLQHAMIDYPEDKPFNKMLIVALYGKLCQRPEAENINYYLDEQNQIHRVSHTVPVQSQHLGLGMWITAWCRIRIMRQLLKIRDAGALNAVIYIDTDAIYMHGDYDELFDLSNDLGNWKIEFTGDMNLIGPKTYQLKDRRDRVATCCSSLPSQIQRSLAWNDLQNGTTFDGYSVMRDPDTWAKVPTPHRFSVTIGDEIERSDPAWVIPEEVEQANGQYE